ncbi:MAG: elongation factor Ts [Patescibacteria group bacterium]|nr:elongation factor Ts [Patescibacteria group bacterium]
MIELIKQIRNRTGAGVIDIKKALEESDGDEKRAIEILRRKGLEKADKKEGRDVKEGVVATYVHSNGKVAAMVKVLCETDFVARNEEFQQLTKDIAMQIVAMSPVCVKPENVPEDEVAQQKKEWKKEMEGENKSQEVMEKIMQGKEQKFRNEKALISQAFIKDQDLTVGDMVKEKISTIGENIIVEDFMRMEL